MSIIFDPDNAVPSSFRALLDYVKDNIGTTAYEIVQSYPAPTDEVFKMPLKKTIIHFEIDDLDPRTFGMGDAVVQAEYNEPDFEITEHEAVPIVVNLDIGIWSSIESGGPSARLDAYQKLLKLFQGTGAFEACHLATDGVEIRDFSGGHFIPDSIGDVRVFRVVNMTLIYRVYGRRTHAPITYVDEVGQEPALVIDDQLIING